jgi:hypothetical protein
MEANDVGVACPVEVRSGVGDPVAGGPSSVVMWLQSDSIHAWSARVLRRPKCGPRGQARNARVVAEAKGRDRRSACCRERTEWTFGTRGATSTKRSQGAACATELPIGTSSPTGRTLPDAD